MSDVRRLKLGCHCERSEMERGNLKQIASSFLLSMTEVIHSYQAPQRGCSLLREYPVHHSLSKNYPTI